MNLALLLIGTLLPWGGPNASQAPTTCSGSAPTGNSCLAVYNTVLNNSLCTNLTQFVVEIGNSTGPLYTTTGGMKYAATNGNSGSPAYSCPGSGIGTFKNGCPASTTINSMSTVVPFASGAKWWYGAYVAQLYGGPSSVPAAQQPFMNFTSGYVSMGDSGYACAGISPPTINQCLTQSNAGVPYTTKTNSFVGYFDYDSGHFENHAGQYGAAINTLYASTSNHALVNAITNELSLTVSSYYTNPLLSGALVGTGADYRKLLIAIINGSLALGANLTYNAACTQGGDTYTVDANGNTTTSFTCQQGAAVYGTSPLSPDDDYYSFGHWIEVDPRVNGDGASSSPGSIGIYPWVEKGLGYYGVLSRWATPGYYSLGQQGQSSLFCGRLLRRAWDTGNQQTGSIPQ